MCFSCFEFYIDHVSMDWMLLHFCLHLVFYIDLTNTCSYLIDHINYMILEVLFMKRISFGFNWLLIILWKPLNVIVQFYFEYTLAIYRYCVLFDCLALPSAKWENINCLFLIKAVLLFILRFLMSQSEKDVNCALTLPPYYATKPSL